MAGSLQLSTGRASRIITSDGAMPWLLVAALLGLLALGAAVLPAAALRWLDWQPGLAWPQWWRAVSAVAVHYSAQHLLVNLLGTLVVAALGRVAALPLRCSIAWLLAWPLTQIGLLLAPELRHFGGLSGVLHAGVVIAAVHLAWAARGTPRWIGFALLIGVALKILIEQPWGAPLRHPAGWEIALAPLAHATGAAAGLGSALLAEAWATRRGGTHRWPENNN
ncbi:rhombosortase [Piscinibacter sakaiensis]|uniref:rhombosortase n=1 Tax=Piscinibacter sakaiensis TaxID=1547922 RepID=UPI003AAFC74A